METLKFKTNINCSGCVKSITPHMTDEAGIVKWKVDTDDPKKILTVEVQNMIADDVVKLVEKAGFKAEKV